MVAGAQAATAARCQFALGLAISVPDKGCAHSVWHERPAQSLLRSGCRLAGARDPAGSRTARLLSRGMLENGPKRMA